MKALALLGVVSAVSIAFEISATEAILSCTRSGDQIVSYAPGGAGFAFSPNTDIDVGALAYCGFRIQYAAVQVSIWDTNGLQLASALVSTNSPKLAETYYESSSGLRLTAGKTYFLRAVEPDQDAWGGDYLSTNGPSSNGTFSVAAEINYLASARGTNSAGGFPGTLGTNAELYLGPNFIYTLPVSVVITQFQTLSGTVQIDFSVTNGADSSYTLLESGNLAGPWTTNLAAMLITNVPRVAYTFTAPATNPAQFFRVRTP
jgi:hypothetical protein